MSFSWSIWSCRATRSSSTDGFSVDRSRAYIAVFAFSPTHRTRVLPMNKEAAATRRKASLKTPSGLGVAASKDISGALNTLLADIFALYMKTKNFHWHMSGPHFRDYHLLLDEQADQIYAITDTIAKRVRKLGGTTLRSIKHVSALQRIDDNDADYVTPLDMLAELRDDNERLAGFMRAAHAVCD